MNAVSLVIEPALPKEIFDRAVDDVNCWRGRCLASFTRAEQAVVTCIANLPSPTREGLRPRPSHLTGQRYGLLAEALERNEWKGRHSRKALAALRQIEPYHQFRALLCHAQTQVLLDRQGRWTTSWRMASLKGTDLLNAVEVVTQDDAASMGAHLKSASDRLVSILGNVGRELAA